MCPRSILRIYSKPFAFQFFPTSSPLPSTLPEVWFWSYEGSCGCLAPVSRHPDQFKLIIVVQFSQIAKEISYPWNLILYEQIEKSAASDSMTILWSLYFRSKHSCVRGVFKAFLPLRRITEN